MPETVYIHVDGAVSGNPGPASIGVVLREVPGLVLAEIAESIGQATNNEAEYHAVLRGLAEAKTRGYGRVRLYSDSELVVRQVRAEWACREARLGALLALVLEAGGALERFEIVWIPRQKNRLADRLASETLDKHLGREGRQNEFTFHNFRRLQEENQELRAEIQKMKNQNQPSEVAA